MNCRSLLVAPFLFLSILASAADVPANKGDHEHDHPKDLQFAIRSVAGSPCAERLADAGNRHVRKPHSGRVYCPRAIALYRWNES